MFLVVHVALAQLRPERKAAVFNEFIQECQEGVAKKIIIKIF